MLKKFLFIRGEIYSRGQAVVKYPAGMDLEVTDKNCEEKLHLFS